MIKRFRDFSIQNKLMIIILSVVFIVAGMLMIITLMDKITTTKQNLVDNTLLNARITGQYCSAGLYFQRIDAAGEALEKLSVTSNILNARVYDETGEIFAGYDRVPIENEILKKYNLRRESHIFDENGLIVIHPLTYPDNYLGSLVIRASTEELDREIKSHIQFSFFLGILLIIISYLLAWMLQRKISGPVTELAKVAKKVTEQGDYSHRVKKHGDDETGQLYDEFNYMMEQLQKRGIERDAAEAALRASEKRYRELIENQGEGIAVIDSEGVFRFTNPAAHKIFGIDGKSLSTWSIDRFLSKEQQWFFQRRVNSLAPGNKLTYELSITNFDDKNIDLLITATPDYDEYGTYQGSFLILRDITARKKMEIELRKAKDKAEQSDRFKSEFLAQMSHEIRSPINVILSFTNLLKDEVKEKLDGEFVDCFDSIDSGGRRIIRTIDMILNMSEIHTGIIEISPARLDLNNNILPGLIREYRGMASSKGLKLFFSNPRNLDFCILADEQSITQIFSNLVDNAIKYTKEGQVEIISSLDKEQRPVVDVVDTGIGISEEYIPYLFDVFSQEETGYTRKFEGNGLGLALVKKYCELNNAEISVDSKKGVGTRFRVVFDKSAIIAM